MSDDRMDIVFCEGCGARLEPSDRTCPKCGRPAPGILSESASASDLAAGKTASFPRLTPDMLVESVPAPSAPQILADSLDPESTNVLDADSLAQAEDSSRKAARAAKRAQRRAERDAAREYRRPRYGRWVALACVVIALAGGAWFVTSDPLGVMPGFYAQFEHSAAEMFPSRQVAEQPAEDPDAAKKEDGDGTLSDDEAYQQLSGLYGRILNFQDDLGPVVDDFNGWFKASDLARRQEASKSAYAMRDNVQKTIDELNALKLADGSVYAEDVDHLKQLADWMYNRVDVLCKSWDISLGYTGDDKPYKHEAEILAPLRSIEMQDGKAVDVIQFEQHVYEWQPQQK